MDFDSLDIINPLDIANLTYDENGTPLRASRGSEIRWYDCAKRAIRSNLTTLLRTHRGPLQRYETAFNEIKAISADPAPVSDDLLMESEKLLDAAVAMRKAAEDLQLISEAEVQELRKYVECLRLSAEGTEQ